MSNQKFHVQESLMHQTNSTACISSEYESIEHCIDPVYLITTWLTATSNELTWKSKFLVLCKSSQKSVQILRKHKWAKLAKTFLLSTHHLHEFIHSLWCYCNQIHSVCSSSNAHTRVVSEYKSKIHTLDFITIFLRNPNFQTLEPQKSSSQFNLYLDLIHLA